MKEDLTREIELKEKISVRLENNVLKVKGPKGELEREFTYPGVFLTVEGNKIILRAPQATKREKKIIGAFESHIINMVKGVEELHEYRLKICSGHFPMSVSVSGSEFVIKNFMGEVVPRKVHLVKNVDVKINGNIITICSLDKEAAGQAAAQIESLCRVTNRDRRIFQDGCYITHKAGKDL
ncbi:MAG: 50S ribosomal protein L6 [Nanoarchaeota archaeon]